MFCRVRFSTQKDQQNGFGSREMLFDWSTDLRKQVDIYYERDQIKMNQEKCTEPIKYLSKSLKIILN